MKNRLNEVSMDNWYQCIDSSLRKSNLKRDDLNYLAILHIKRSGHLMMLESLGLNENQTIYLEEYGHIGQVDQILSLHLGVQQYLSISSWYWLCLGFKYSEVGLNECVFQNTV